MALGRIQSGRYREHELICKLAGSLRLLLFDWARLDRCRRLPEDDLLLRVGLGVLLVEGASREGRHLLVHDELVALVDEPTRLLLLLAPL